MSFSEFKQSNSHIPIHLNGNTEGYKKHISTEEDESGYLGKAYDGTLEMGKSTGFFELDKYYRFKQGNLVMMNGHDNVGKSAFMWFLAVVSNYLHGWKWLLWCDENSTGQVRKSLIQFKTGKSIRHLNSDEYDIAKKWAYENFMILKTDDLIYCSTLINIAEKVFSEFPYNAFLMDPYNALDLDLERTRLTSHEYHYRMAIMMRNFCRKTKASMYVNMHAITESLRRIYKSGDYAGYTMPPEKADTEGGGKFPNKADEFFTLHRHAQHPTEYNTSMLYIRKVKDTETGGRPSPKDEPVKFKMIKGKFGYFDEQTHGNPMFPAQKPVVERISPPSKPIQQEIEDLMSEKDDRPF